MNMKINHKKGMFFVYFIHAILLTLVVEAIHRASLIDTLKYAIEMPMRMLVNLAIIAIATSMVLFVKRKKFFITVIWVVWIVLSLTSRTLLTLRDNPFTISDLVMIREGLEVSAKYISWQGAIAILIGVVVIIGSLIYLWKRDRGIHHSGRKKFFYIWISAFAIGMLLFNQLQQKEIMAAPNPDLSTFYDNNGFVFSLVDTTVNYFKQPNPENYNEETIASLMKSLQKEQVSGSSEKPNIIMVQLESFLDPMWIKGVSYSKDPIPTFREIENKFSSGQLVVPTVGAGTVRTEFEVLTGLSMKFLTPWEIPNNTVLKETPVESIARTMHSQGYQTQAIHNNEGIFYDRNKVYSNMGFDTYISMEYMNGYEKTPTGWLKDGILTKEVEKALNATEKRDFIYTVTVQDHGGYPSDDVLPLKHVTVTNEEKGGNNNQDTSSLEYYVNQLYETDLFIRDLLHMVEQRQEPTIVVLFSDHLPKLPQVQAENLTTNDRFIVPYVIWDNMNLPKQKKDLHAYTLSTEVLNRASLQGGIVNQLHNRYEGKSDYEEKYELLQYDLLYGDKYAYAGKSLLEPSNMVMGLEEIVVSNVMQQEETTVVEGENFTLSSVVVINEKEQNTIFIDENRLLVENYTLKGNESIQVQQIGRKMLSGSNVLTLDDEETK
ncbi:MAG: LTA synthase family protein [Bacillaceae bacterium]